MGPQLLERESELAAIDGALEAACAGRGRIVVVEGPAGAGKSALLAAAGAEARARGLEVLTARAGALERTFAFGVCLQLFGTALAQGDAGEPVGGPVRHARALLEREEGAIAIGGPDEGRLHAILLGLAALSEKLAGGGALLLCVDDAHWADVQTLQFVDFLARRLEGLAVAVVLGVRSGDPGADGVWIRGLRQLGSVERRRLAPLSGAAVGALVRARIDGADDALCGACAVATKGNPFYLRCVLDALERDRGGIDPAAVSRMNVDAIADTVLVRAAALGERSRALINAVAVIGDGYPLALVADMAGLSLDQARGAVGLLARADILEASETLTFTHPIVREAVYGDVPAVVRSGEHLRAARALAQVGADPEIVAAQLLRGGCAGHSWAVEALRRAAARALARAAPAAAAEYLARAMSEPPADEERGAVLHELGVAEVMAGAASGREHLLEGIRLAPPGVPKAVVTRSLSRALVWRAEFEQAVAVLSEAVEQLPSGERELALELEAEIATAGRLNCSTYAQAVRRLLRLAESEPITGATPAELMILANMAMTRLFESASADEVADLAARALAGGLLARTDPTGGTTSGSPTFYDALLALTLADRIELASEASAAALAEAIEHGSLFAAGLTRCFRSQLAWRRGDLRSAETVARAALDIGLDGGFVFTPIAVAGLLDALVDRARLDDATTALQAVGLDRDLPDFLPANWVLPARARLRIAQGDLASGLADLCELQRRATSWSGADPRAHSYRALMAEALSMLGRLDEAQGLAAEDLVRARKWGTPRAIGIAMRAQGLAQRGVGAIEPLRRSVELLATAPAPLEQARALTDLGAALRREGARTEAREILRQAIDLARRCEALAIQDRAAQELSAAGGHLRRARLSGVEALTPSELRVARLAADGLTNREIAQTLYLSPKTIEMHLHRTYRKLDVTSRRQLGSALTARA